MDLPSGSRGNIMMQLAHFHPKGTPKADLSTSPPGSPMGPISQDLLCLTGPSAFFPVGHS